MIGRTNAVMGGVVETCEIITSPYDTIYVTTDGSILNAYSQAVVVVPKFSSVDIAVPQYSSEPTITPAENVERLTPYVVSVDSSRRNHYVYVIKGDCTIL